MFVTEFLELREGPDGRIHGPLAMDVGEVGEPVADLVNTNWLVNKVNYLLVRILPGVSDKIAGVDHARRPLTTLVRPGGGLHQGAVAMGRLEEENSREHRTQNNRCVPHLGS